MDLPGHGESSMIQGRPSVAALTDAVEADLDAHGLGRVHLLGNSLGGRVAIELASGTGRGPWFRFLRAA